MRFDIESATADSPPLHVHPHAEESYRVLSGALEVNVEGEWRQVPAGERHSVPAGRAHTFRNEVAVELIDVHEPALDHEREVVSVRPPQTVMKFLARLGRLLGYPPAGLKRRSSRWYRFWSGWRRPPRRPAPWPRAWSSARR